MHRKFQATKNILGGLWTRGLVTTLTKIFSFFCMSFFARFFPHLAPTNKINQKFKIKTDMGHSSVLQKYLERVYFFPALSLGGLDRCVF